MKDQLNIPKSISVGFQNRTDTYTGKLAYVIYTDHKGVLRKQSSWDHWRDQQIPIQTFDNVPTSGFVLNKKVGETRWGWNPRKAWVRVYDPRDFEFEISVANLLFILEETSAIKGKGLEGELVYSWDKSDLVLLPVDSLEYKNSSNFTALQLKKISRGDIVAGSLYRSKDNQQVMYLGRLDWYEMKTNYSGNSTFKQFGGEKSHVFVSVDGKSTYWVQSGFTKLAERITTEASPLFAEEFEKFKKSVHGSKPKILVSSPRPIRQAETNYHYGEAYAKELDGYHHLSWNGYADQYNLAHAAEPVTIDEKGQVKIPRDSSYSRRSVTKGDFEATDKYDLFLQNEEGNLIQL